MLSIDLDEFILMPNRLHGIIRVLTVFAESVTPASLSSIIGAFQSISSRRYADGVLEFGWEPFDGRLWQRSFYDQIIRSPQHLDNVRAYIIDNLRNWINDDLHPSRSDHSNLELTPDARRTT